MSRYVCDFNEVNRASTLLHDAANNMKSYTNKYSTGINANLSQWTGAAKNSFSSSNEKQIEMMNSQVEYLESLGEFVKKSAARIETLDNELAELEI